MLKMIEDAVHSPPIRRCPVFAARLEEEALIKHGHKVLDEGASESVFKKDAEEAPPADAEPKKDDGDAPPKPTGHAIEALDEPGDSMEPKEKNLSDKPAPSKALHSFGPSDDPEA